MKSTPEQRLLLVADEDPQVRKGNLNRLESPSPIRWRR